MLFQNCTLCDCGSLMCKLFNCAYSDYVVLSLFGLVLILFMLWRSAVSKLRLHQEYLPVLSRSHDKVTSLNETLIEAQREYVSDMIKTLAKDTHDEV